MILTVPYSGWRSDSIIAILLAVATASNNVRGPLYREVRYCLAFDGRFKLMVGRTEKADSTVCNADVLVPFGGADAPYFYRHVPCGPGVDEQGFPGAVAEPARAQTPPEVE